MVWCVCVGGCVFLCVTYLHQNKKHICPKSLKKNFHDFQFLFRKTSACNISSFPLSNCHNNIAQNIDLSQITVL